MSMKKVLFCLLTVVMVLGCLGVQAFAEENSIPVAFLAEGEKVEGGIESVTAPDGYKIISATFVGGELIVNVELIETEPKTKEITISYADPTEDYAEVSSVTVTVDASAETVSEELVADNVPDGYELLVSDEEDFSYTIYGDTVFADVVKTATEPVEPETKEITISYADEDYAEVSSVTVTVDASAETVSAELVANHMPYGYELVSCDYVIYMETNTVYVDVKETNPAPVEPEEPAKEQIILSYIADGSLYQSFTYEKTDDMDIEALVELNMPADYRLVECDYTPTADGVVFVYIEEIVEEPVTEEITLSYEVDGESIKTVVYDKTDDMDIEALVAENMIEGYELVDCDYTPDENGVVVVEIAEIVEEPDETPVEPVKPSLPDFGWIKDWINNFWKH